MTEATIVTGRVIAAGDADVDDVQRSIADDILASVERGDLGRWTMPWHSMAAKPTNAFTSRPFRGQNLVALWAAARRRKFKVHLWASPESWERNGASLRSGEVGTWILVPKRDEKAKPKAWVPGQPGIEKKLGPLGGDAEGGEMGASLGFKKERWLNHAQVDGAPPAADLQRQPSPDEGAARVDEQLAAWRCRGGPALVEGGLKACWDPRTDRITLPPLRSFADRDGLSGRVLRSGTNAHEHFHASGSRRRLGRPMKFKHGSQDHAVEEMTVELAAAFLCAEFGLPTAMRDDHAAYVASWLSVLREEKRRSAFFRAVGQASKAVDFVKQAAGP